MGAGPHSFSSNAENLGPTPASVSRLVNNGFKIDGLISSTCSKE
tara:strand:- start:388 stop:519 length:132 start_codon:yes stop_codon:yes gene_type:complete